MSRRLALLLGGCLAGAAAGCSEREAEVFNRLVGRRLLQFADAALGNLSLKTVGDCSAVTSPDQKPCRGIPTFPLHEKGEDWELDVEYVTGLNSLRMTNISLRCDPNSTAAPSQLAWFTQLDVTMAQFAMMVSAHVDFPKLQKTMLESVPNLTAHMVARATCVNDTSLELQLDPAEGSLTLSKVPVDISIIHVDVSRAIVQAVRSKLDRLVYTPPAKWIKLTKTLCSQLAPLEAESALVI